MILLEAEQALDYTNNYCLYLKMEGSKKLIKSKAPYKSVTRLTAHPGASEIDRKQKASKKIQS